MPAPSALESAADTALLLLAQLEASQDSADPVWRGDDAEDTLRITAQVVSALDALGLGGITDAWVRPALDWLKDQPAPALPEAPDSGPEQARRRRTAGAPPARSVQAVA